MLVESLSAPYDSLNGGEGVEEVEEVEEGGWLSGESLMCSQTVSLQICVHVCVCMGEEGGKQQTDNNPELCMSVPCEEMRDGGGGDGAEWRRG